MQVKLNELEKAKLNQPYISNAHINYVSFWESMVVFSQHHLRKF